MISSVRSARSAASLFLLSGILLLGSAVTNPADAGRRHLSLVKSAPMADSVVTAPAAIQLWFSEPVELGVTRVRLTTADAKPVALGALRLESDGKDPVVTATIPASLAAGAYTVNWSTASKDGHVVRSSFVFTVRAP